MSLYKVSWKMNGYCESLVEAGSPEEARRRASPEDIDREQIDELEWSVVDVIKIEE